MNIKDLVRKIQAHGINVIGNYIFGLPDDDLNSMKETLDLAKELNCEFANFYSAMAYPGSNLYHTAARNGWALPQDWNGYSQHSSKCTPLPTKYLSAKEVLSFRDYAFHDYFSNENYLKMLENKFGPNISSHVKEINEIKLSRELLS